MAKNTLLQNYLKEDRKEIKLIGQVLAQREKRRKAENQLRRALKIATPVKITQVPAKTEILSSTDKKTDTAKPWSANSIQTICLNCGQATPIDSSICIQCRKNPYRKEA